MSERNKEPNYNESADKELLKNVPPMDQEDEDEDGAVGVIGGRPPLLTPAQKAALLKGLKITGKVLSMDTFVC